MNGKIGVGIITHNRPEFFQKIIQTIPDYVDLYVINTGSPYDETVYNSKTKITYRHQCDEKTCVGHGKNVALQTMLDDGYTHLFTMEDDVYVKDPNVYHNYIKAAHVTGIWHFNFGFSQRENIDDNGTPIIRKRIAYPDGTHLIFTPNILGAFTYFYSGILKHTGLHNEGYNHNHMDHVDLTLRVIKAGLHPAFWWFADIDKSWEMIGNLSNMGTDSLVRNEVEGQQYFRDACILFHQTHGYIPTQVPQTEETVVMQQLKDIRGKYQREYTP